MTSFSELARQRFSQRAYDPSRPIPKQLLEEILETAHFAPSAANKQPWEIVVIQTPDMLDRIHAAYTRDWFLAAPCVIALKGKTSQAWVRAYDGFNALETDLAILMDHLTLAAADLGLGTCWIAHFEPTVLAEALSLTSDERVVAISPLGWAPSDFKPPTQKTRKPLSEIVKYL